MFNPTNTQDTSEEIREWYKLKGQQLASLVERCQASGYWDGKIRNGHVTKHQLKEMGMEIEKFCKDEEVQIQLYLQIRETGHLIRSFPPKR